MSKEAQGTGAAVFIGYVVHIIFDILASKEKLNLKTKDIDSRVKKFYIFAVVGLLSVHYSTVFGTLFAWVTLVFLVGYYASAAVKDPKGKRKWFATTGMLYSSFLTMWWIG
mmetsp:Transcript_37057/g.33334  ORF Transcript_37057/g.33334 Transcript_37057/m.33334 type:complete len:111 (+) Transcript_37057:68-400(+)